MANPTVETHTHTNQAKLHTTTTTIANPPTMVTAHTTHVEQHTTHTTTRISTQRTLPATIIPTPPTTTQQLQHLTKYLTPK
jgi:hypothetical protein